MRLFISWSGERSRALAVACRDWFPLILHYVEPWVSEADIEAGERWAQSLATELEACNFGIVCLTPENVHSPWVQFEAGALAKSLESGRVIPLLLDLEFSEVSGPLAQFQAKKLTRQGVGEVVQSLQASAQNPIPDDRVKRLLETLWPDFEASLADIPGLPSSERLAKPSQHDVLEDLVAVVRGLDARLRDSEAAMQAFTRATRAELYTLQIALQDWARRRLVSPDDLLALKNRNASVAFNDWLDRIAAEITEAIPSGLPPRPRPHRPAPQSDLFPSSLDAEQLRPPPMASSPPPLDLSWSAEDDR